MKKYIFIFLALFILSAVSNGSLYSQDDNMKKWMEYMTPGDMHKMLATHTGKWTAKTAFWMSPGGEPTVSDATAEGEMIFDGRYLVSRYKGNMMGMPFEGMAVEGYDNAAKMFMSTWIDNMGTGIMYMTGTWDETAKQINYSGKMMDPMSSSWVEIKQIVKFNTDGTTTMEMYGPGPDGKEFKNMEIIYTKQ
jgi:hypothetical protein